MRMTSPAAIRRNGIIVGSGALAGPGFSVTEPVLPSPPPNSPGGRVALPSPSSDKPPAVEELELADRAQAAARAARARRRPRPARSGGRAAGSATRCPRSGCCACSRRACRRRRGRPCPAGRRSCPPRCPCRPRRRRRAAPENATTLRLPTPALTASGRTGRQRAHDRVGDDVARAEARDRRRREARVGDRALRHRDRDRPEQPGVGRDRLVARRSRAGSRAASAGSRCRRCRRAAC